MKTQYAILQDRINSLKRKIFRISGDKSFTSVTLEIFRLQATYNPVYRRYLKLLSIDPSHIFNINDIPFLPVTFFRDLPVTLLPESYEKIFTSSGTTGTQPSKHYIPDLSLYRESFTRNFNLFYGDISGYCILALLPSYLERSGSSLVYMLDHLIRLSGCPESGFYLYDHDRLFDTLRKLAGQHKKTLLFGVSFALLDFAEQYELPPEMDLIVMETGGMKGRRKEMVREELHAILKKKFHVPAIHSEYGMTELLSQSYSSGNGIFHTPPWMQVVIRDSYDPFTRTTTGHTGGINVIDLANLWSCPFIETQDLGRALPDGSFTVEGRFDHSEMRGCNLMVQDI